MTRSPSTTTSTNTGTSHLERTGQMKILTVFGTRPEAIKLAPVIKRFERPDSNVESIVCVTSQHREMLDQVLDLFDIRPHHNLNLMTPNQSLGELTARALSAVEEVIRAESPDVVIVQGDTTTTFAAALAAFYQRVLIAHVEAGLRSFDRFRPYPEEINRRVASVLADIHFPPTELAREHLLREGIDDSRIAVTGNTGIDALFMVSEKAAEYVTSEVVHSVLAEAKRRKLLLVTAHRRESFGEPFEGICRALRQIADGNEDLFIVYPVHLNPNIQEPAKRLLGDHPRITLIEPLDYAPFVAMLDAAYLVLTDSGGIQEEAPSLGKPVIVLREVTERVEALEAGTAVLVGTDTDGIIAETQHLLDDTAAYAEMSGRVNPFGDGRASERIARYLGRFASDHGLA